MSERLNRMAVEILKELVIAFDASLSADTAIARARELLAEIEVEAQAILVIDNGSDDRAYIVTNEDYQKIRPMLNEQMRQEYDPLFAVHGA